MRTPRHASGLDRLAQRAALAVVILLTLVTLASGLTGCASSGDANPLTKLRAMLRFACDTGDTALAAAETLTREPVDAGKADASPASESDAATDNDGGTDR